MFAWVLLFVCMFAVKVTKLWDNNSTFKNVFEIHVITMGVHESRHKHRGIDNTSQE